MCTTRFVKFPHDKSLCVKNCKTVAEQEKLTKKTRRLIETCSLEQTAGFPQQFLLLFCRVYEKLWQVFLWQVSLNEGTCSPVYKLCPGCPEHNLTRTLASRFISQAIIIITWSCATKLSAVFLPQEKALNIQILYMQTNTIAMFWRTKSSLAELNLTNKLRAITLL